MLNTRKLKARMIELGLTQKNIADALKIAPATASQKLNGIRPLYLHEAKIVAEVLLIDDSQFSDYFFCAANCATQNLR